MTLRNQILESQLADRIDNLNQPGLVFNTMSDSFLNESLAELQKTSRVSQEVYDLTLDHTKKLVEFFDKQSNLVDTLYNIFTTMPLEIQINYRAYIGPQKQAALKAVCKQLDPLYDPLYHPFSPVANVEECLLKIDALLTGVINFGENSPVVMDFFSLLAGTPIL
jgi:hypothetical protein